MLGFGQHSTLSLALLNKCPSKNQSTPGQDLQSYHNVNKLNRSALGQKLTNLFHGRAASGTDGGTLPQFSSWWEPESRGKNVKHQNSIQKGRYPPIIIIHTPPPQYSFRQTKDQPQHRGLLTGKGSSKRGGRTDHKGNPQGGLARQKPGCKRNRNIRSWEKGPPGDTGGQRCCQVLVPLHPRKVS